MPRPDDYYDDDEMYEDDYLEDDDFLNEEEDHDNKKMGGAASWILSAFIHFVIIASLIYFVIGREETPEDKIITTSTILEEEEEEEEVKEIEVVKQKVEIQEEIVVETPVITEEEVTEEHMETENEMEAETAEGVSEAISDMPLVGSGLMGNIGGGGGGGGAFGQRSGGGKKRAVMRGGGSKKTESAVDWALWWLAEHQEPNGQWDTGKWEGDGKPETDMGSSGAALLAFLGAGHTDKVGKYKDNVRRALKWITDNQKPNGTFDARNYANGICTMAVAEAVGMGCGTTQLRKKLELAVDYLLKQQNDGGPYNYTKSTRHDMSVTGWCIMGLKSAMLAGIRENEIKKAFKECGEFYDSRKDTTGDNTSTSQGKAWYTPERVTHPWSACAAIAMLVRQYLGWKRSEPWLMAATKGQVSKLPVNMKNMNVYRVYYAYLALFQQGGQEWKTWNENVTKVVVAGQRQDGDFRGSWDNNGKGHMKKGGRVLTTAFLCLSLEVYYRYKSVMR